jgi:DNA-binding XRE family transcriptional regulator
MALHWSSFHKGLWETGWGDPPHRRETIVFPEKGRYNPSPRLAWAVAQALLANIGEIFSFEDERDGLESCSRSFSMSSIHLPEKRVFLPGYRT